MCDITFTSQCSGMQKNDSATSTFNNSYKLNDWVSGMQSKITKLLQDESNTAHTLKLSLICDQALERGGHLVKKVKHLNDNLLNHVQLHCLHCVGSHRADPFHARCKFCKYRSKQYTTNDARLCLLLGSPFHFKVFFASFSLLACDFPSGNHSLYPPVVFPSTDGYF